MNLKENASATCIGEPVLTNCVDDSLLRAADESCNISIKDEPLDITECSLKDFKSELEDFDLDIKNESFPEENTNSASDSIEINVGNIIGRNTSGIIKKSLNNITNNKVPVTRKVIINGQKKTCILVKNPALKDDIMKRIQGARETVNNAPSPHKEVFNKSQMNFMVISPDQSNLTDHTYSLGCSVVHMNNFKQHINSCFPRNTLLEKVSCDEANEHKIRSPNQTVAAVYNPCSGEVMDLSNNVDILNNSNKYTNDSNLKGDQLIRFSNNNQPRNSDFNCNNNLKSTALKTRLSFPSYNEQLQKNEDEKNLVSTESSNETKRGRRYNCNLCSYVTHKLSYLKFHKTCHVKKMPIVQSDKCAFRSTKPPLQARKIKHRSATHPRASPGKTVMTLKTVQRSTEGSLLLEDNTFSCSICSFTTDEQQLLKDHERNHRRTNLPIVECCYCNQRYTKYMLYLHIKKIHPGQRYRTVSEPSDELQTTSFPESSISSLSTTEENSLEEHVRTYDSENDEQSLQFKRNLKCSLCSFSTSDGLTLELHLGKHLFEPIQRKTIFGRTQYDCRMCSCSQLTLASIDQHINCHRKNLPIRKCPKCDFKSTPLALVHHVRKCKF